MPGETIGGGEPERGRRETSVGGSSSSRRPRVEINVDAVRRQMNLLLEVLALPTDRLTDQEIGDIVAYIEDRLYGES